MNTIVLGALRMNSSLAKGRWVKHIQEFIVHTNYLTALFEIGNKSTYGAKRTAVAYRKADTTPMGGDFRAYGLIRPRVPLAFVRSVCISRRMGELIGVRSVTLSILSVVQPPPTIEERLGNLKQLLKDLQKGCSDLEPVHLNIEDKNPLDGIRHRLIRPYRPQTNGMVERFNRRISEALRHKAYISTNTGRNKFRSHRERDQFIRPFVDNYNKTRLKCLGYKAPLEALEEAIRIHKNQAGHNTSERMKRVMSGFDRHGLPWRRAYANDGRKFSVRNQLGSLLQAVEVCPTR